MKQKLEFAVVSPVVPERANVVLSWWPVVGWMAVMFTMSTDLGSAAHTSRLIEPLLHWIAPGISREAVEWIHFFVRKGAHLTEYAILAVLMLRAMRLRHPMPAAQPWRLALAAWFCAVLFAAGDEFHQRFVASRGASVRDVGIDSCGAALGLAGVCMRLRRRRTE